MTGNRYEAYLQRFEQRIGPLPVGSYGKWKGQLVRKLAPDEFELKRAEWTTLANRYRAIVERGDTLNNALTKLLREHQTELLLEEDPADESPDRPGQ